MKKLFIILLLLTECTFATQSDQTKKIQIMITNIKNASQANRFELMNEFKIELKSMNEEARKKAFFSLQNSLKQKEQKSVNNSSNTSESNLLKIQQQQEIQIQQRLQQNQAVIQKNINNKGPR